MQSSRPLLTIAVPTFNRARYLEQFFSVLFDQVRDEPSVELIVSDNASPDDTSVVVRRYQDKGLLIRYVRNPENIGPDGNILQCFDLATGKYVWVFGDDDVIEPGGVVQILSLLVSEAPDIVFCAHYGFRGSYQGPLSEIRARRSTEIIEDPVRFVHLANRHGDFVFISAVITNKDLILQNGRPPFHQLLQTNLVQLGWHFTALKHFRKGIFVDLGTVAGTAAESGFEPDAAARVFGLNYANAVDTFIEPRSSLAKALINDQLFLWFPRHWIHMRRRSSLPMTAAHQILKARFARYPLYWLIVYPMVKLPLHLARIYTKFIRVIQRVTRIDLIPAIRPARNAAGTNGNAPLAAERTFEMAPGRPDAG